MNDTAKTTPDTVTAERPAPQAERRTVSDPRDVATLVMSRMSVVNAKKDELTIAIKGLSDVTQQLAHAYAEQMKVIEKLVKRVKALEAADAARGLNGSKPS
ncbi:hypothetical protein [Hydrogenophaga sp. 2FB]|uniref:hypothetical protein n=1 Tax=Hydrogenophaga sp. 2FB TaxID=2502187 RepID=UPI0010F9EEC8|nr:hypothetical protein [Hydrogenophaga sp. 2FB]